MSRWQVAIAVDQLGNAILFNGWADETISAHCWRCQTVQPYATLRPVVDALFFFNKDHCKSAYESEMQRLQSPPEER